MGKGKRFFIGLVVLGAGYGLQTMFTFVTSTIAGTTALPLNLDQIIKMFSLVFMVIGGGIMALVLTQVTYQKIRAMLTTRDERSGGDRRPYSERIQERRRRPPSDDGGQ